MANPNSKRISKDAIAEIFREYRYDKPPTHLVNSLGGYKSLFELTRTHPDTGLSTNNFKEINQTIYNIKDFISVPKRGIYSFVSYIMEDSLLKIAYIFTIALFHFALGKGNHSATYESAGVFIFLSLLVLLVAGFRSYYYHYLVTIKEISNGKYTKVLRDGKSLSVPIWELKFGDIVQLSAGSTIYASGILIQGVDLIVEQKEKVGNSGLHLKQTMKKELLEAQSPNSFLISESRVLAGHGRMITLVGDYVSQEQNVEHINDLDSSTKKEFQNATIHFGARFTFVLLMVILIYFSSQITKLFISRSLPTLSLEFLMRCFREIITLLCLIIVCVNENSSLIVIASLSSAVSRAKQNQILVRNYGAFQNLRSINRICIDEAVLSNNQTNKNSLKESLLKLKQQNVSIVLMTDKQRVDALTFAQQIGIVDLSEIKGGQVEIRSEEFRQNYISTVEDKDETTSRIGKQAPVQSSLSNLRVFCQASTSDKLDLIWYLTQMCKQSVCVIGVQNAEILSMATVSISLGIPSTPHLSSSSDIVVLNQSISSIDYSIQASRSILSSINRFTQFKFQTCIGLFVLQSIYYLAKSRPLFTAPQILWISILIDVASIVISQLGSSIIVGTAFGPRNWVRIGILSSHKLIVIVYITVTQTTSTGTQLLIFHTFILMTIAGLFAKNSPSFYNLKRSLFKILSVMIVVILVQSCLIGKIYQFIGTGQLNPAQQLQALLLSSSVFAVNLVVDILTAAVRRNK